MSDTPAPAAPVNQRVCWFCGRALTGSRANEHVFPLWIQDELSLRNLEITPSWHAQPLGELLDERRQTWGTLVAGRICSICNNGWMSDLETTARPILLPLIRGERLVASLSHSEQYLTARWATKTVYTLSAAIQEKRVPPQQYRALHKEPSKLPTGVHIFATQRQVSKPAHYTVDATWQHSSKLEGEGHAAIVDQHSYKACLQLGRLLLLVVWWPLGTDWVLSAESKTYELLYPEDAKIIWHPAPVPLPQNLVDAVGPSTMHELEVDSGAVCFGLTGSVKVLHKRDVPSWVLARFGITPLGT